MNYKVYSAKDFPTYLPKLSKIYDDLFTGGKGFRGKLIQLICDPMQISDSTQLLLAQTVEFIHNASLLHDDLVDRSPLRRGKTTAWLAHSPEYAVLAGDYLLARVMVNLSSFGNIKLVHYTAEVISDLLEGEWLQDSLIEDFSIDLRQLDRVHNLKTASLFKWCLRAPFLAQENNSSELHNQLEEIGILLGQLFQRSDDLLDFDIRNDEKKAILGDLKSGYLNSFAAFCAQDREPQDREKMKSCRSLADFYSWLGSEELFKQKVQEFDQKNQFLIELCLHKLQNLEKHLGESQKSLIANLSPIPEFLYWRRKPAKNG